METITKEKISDLIKNKLGFSSAICEDITSNIFSEIFALSLRDKKLLLTNFGKFSIRSKDKRTGVNLKTKELTDISPRKVLRFTASKAFKEKLKHYEQEQ